MTYSHLFFLFSMLFSMSFFSMPSQALTDSAARPNASANKQAYPACTADDNATWKGGWFPINVDAQRSLSYSEDGTATLTFEADSVVAGLKEISTFYDVPENPDAWEKRLLEVGMLKR